ncbi:pI10L 1 [African swine fever virus]|uniref:PI10L 1 n=1 Tax=African swine fever virus TaxID=10497 RepID=A0A894KU79_ASF|nr:pI10L 1 [African swine fever virus]
MKYISGYSHYGRIITIFTSWMCICVSIPFSLSFYRHLIKFPSYGTFMLYTYCLSVFIFFCPSTPNLTKIYTCFSKWRLQISSTGIIPIQTRCIFTCTDGTIYFIIFYILFYSFYTTFISTCSTYTVVSFILTICICLTFFFRYFPFYMVQTQYYNIHKNISYMYLYNRIQ